MSEQISTAQLARELQKPSPDCHWSAAHRCVLRTRHRDMFAFGVDPRLSPSLNCLLIKAYRDGKWPLTPEQTERGVLGIEDFLRANPAVRATLHETSRIGPIRGGQISQVLVSKTNVSLCKFICKDSKRAKPETLSTPKPHIETTNRTTSMKPAKPAPAKKAPAKKAPAKAAKAAAKKAPAKKKA